MLWQPVGQSISNCNRTYRAFLILKWYTTSLFITRKFDCLLSLANSWHWRFYFTAERRRVLRIRAWRSTKDNVDISWGHRLSLFYCARKSYRFNHRGQPGNLRILLAPDAELRYSSVSSRIDICLSHPASTIRQFTLNFSQCSKPQRTSVFMVGHFFDLVNSSTHFITES